MSAIVPLVLLLLLSVTKEVSCQQQLQSLYQASHMCLNTSRAPAGSLRQFSARSATICAAKCQQLINIMQWHFEIGSGECSCLSKLASSFPGDNCVSWSRLNHLNTIAYWPLSSQWDLVNCGSAGSPYDGALINGSLLTIDDQGTRFTGVKRDDRINVSGLSNITLSAFSFTAWIKPDLRNSSLPLWEADQDNEYRSGLWLFRSMQEVYLFSFNVTGVLKVYTIGISSTMTKWNFLSVTYNPWNVTNALCASINHTAPVCISVNPSAPVTMAMGNEFWIGGAPTSRVVRIAQAYIGQIKCLAISSRVLGPAELLELAAFC